MRFLVIILIYCVFFTQLNAQVFMLRDTIPVYENGISLKNPWAGGINFSSFTDIDLNLDGKKDLVLYDKICGSGGKLRAFLNVGNIGQTAYKHAPQYQNAFPAVTNFALFYDYNNDGKADLFTYTTGGLKVFKNITTPTAFGFELVKGLVMSNYNPNGNPNFSNIYCNPVALPGIADIDNDGDLDVLSYSVFGIRMEFHKNMSQELYGHSDSLVFNMVDDCWGDIQESNCAVELEQCPFMKMYSDATTNDAEKVMHSGSCIMCFDRDGDGDKDLILGDVSCSEVFYVDNIGTVSNAHIGDTTSLYPNYPNKSSVNRIKLNSFPCTFHVDIDNDGIKDLIASPNSVAGAENYQSVWLYKNTSTTNTVNFVFQKKNFLQDEMIELGEGAYPVLFDADGDGLKDLLIGNLGYYTVNTNKSMIAYYKNNGTASSPSFSLITRDYQNFSSLNIYSMAPTFGDLDGDGDLDLIIGDSNGQLFYFQNTAGAGNTANFSTPVTNYALIDVGSFAYPQIVDVDNDGKLDLLIGSQNGRLAYYKNTGSTTNPNFTLQSNFFGNVDVRRQGYITGFSVPYLYREAGQTKLLVGSEVGTLFYFNNIDNNLTGTFNKIDSAIYNIHEGTRSYPYFEDLNNDGLRDLLIGNHAGGLAFFKGSNVVSVNELDDLTNQLQIKIFPNPTKNSLYINCPIYVNHSIQIFDMLGKELKRKSLEDISSIIDVSDIPRGIIIVRIFNSVSGFQHIEKIILE